MSLVTLAGAVFCLLALVVELFQMALALGAPLGHLAMGGRWTGRLPVALRAGAVIQGGVMVAMARVAAGASGLLVPVGPGWLIWVAVAVMGLSTLMNNITPSRPERRLWGPVTVIMFLALILVAVRA
ncbi:hypothetical protein GQE99_13330 [Maritimibacter sp. DP07]|uniref:DoxX-like family protein n=1 Tax=Maritimibacter harenae TaxID=2606218 RepID=A0A845M680_9RHOB|nr:hypothetical protein [Maritimibacter harenae]MZR13998.1 hypothetical protein [Maritimibacter harenae]